MNGGPSVLVIQLRVLKPGAVGTSLLLYSYQTCQDQVVPNFQEIHSPVSIPYPTYRGKQVLWPPRTSQSGHQEYPRSHLGFSINPTWSSSASPPHTSESCLVHSVEWHGGGQQLPTWAFKSAFQMESQTQTLPPSGERRRGGQNLWYSDLGPVPPDSHSVTQKSV